MSKDSLYFGDHRMDIGDLIAIETSNGPSFPSQSAVALLDFDATQVTVFLPYHLIHLAHGERQLRIPRKNIRSMRLLMPAVDAIPTRSGSQQFQQNEQVSALAAGQIRSARVIAALENLIAVRLDNGRISWGGASYFRRTSV